MSQRHFCPVEYTLSQNLKLNLKNKKYNFSSSKFRVRVRFYLVSFRFCLSGVLRWAIISLAHFVGRTRCYLVPQ